MSRSWRITSARAISSSARARSAAPGRPGRRRRGRRPLPASCRRLPRSSALSSSPAPAAQQPLARPRAPSASGVVARRAGRAIHSEPSGSPAKARSAASPSRSSRARRPACGSSRRAPATSARSASSAPVRRAVVQRAQRRRCALVAGARLERQRALARRGDELVGVERAAGLVRAAEPLQAGERQHDRVVLALGELAQAGVDVAAQLARPRGRTAQRAAAATRRRRLRRADRRAAAQRVERAARRPARRAGPRARGTATSARPGRQARRHVLGAVHGEVDLAGEQRLLDLLRPSATCRRPRRRGRRTS